MADQTKLAGGVKAIQQEAKEKAVQNKAKELDIPYVNLLTMPLNPDLAKIIPKEVAEAAGLAVFFQSGKNCVLQ